ncbi:C1 family peptidase [Pseudomonas fluorescens]|uniref:C1 family peptidase n=1 Tax=Pseudomonas fluorescens TaxID=294 RepID=UPI0038572E9B
MTAGQPIGLGLRVTSEFFKPEGNVVPFSDRVMAGLLHAVVAIGIGHEEGSSAPWFYVLNSWGPQWGLVGHKLSSASTKCKANRANHNLASGA